MKIAKTARTARTAAVAGVAAAALALSGCGGSSSDDSGGGGKTATQLSTQAEINQQPRSALAPGGTLTTAVAEITPQFNTFEADATYYTGQFWRYYNPQVFTFAADGTAKPDPDYLTGYDKKVVDGKTVVTYTINPKATYNDGTPIDWKTFEATWKANDGTDEKYQAASTDGYSLIESVEEGEDAKQAVVTFSGEYAWVDGLFNILLNPEAASVDTYNKGYLNDPHPEWGAGPYTLDSYDKKGGSISFKPNPKWWGDKGMLSKRTFRALEDTASINAFKAGQTDATSVRSKDRLAQVTGMSGIDIRRSATPAQSLLTLNAGHKILSDLEVRKAVFMGIDRRILGKIEFNGLDYTEKPPGSFSLYPFQKGYVDNLAKAGYRYDPKAATALLEKDGWKKGSDGYFAKGGKTLSLVYATIGDDPTLEAEAKATVSMLKQAGIEVKLEPHPASDFSDVFEKGQFDLFALAFSSSDPFGFEDFCQIWCTDSGLNVSQTGTKAIDTKAKALGKIGDPDEQIEKGNELEQKIMASTYGILPTTNGPTVVAVKKKLANYGAGLFYIGRIEDIGYQK